MTQPQSPRAYKNFTPKMGVWAVRLSASGQVMTDVSPHVESSLNRIRFQLDAGMYPNRDIQQLWQEGGPAAVQLEILDELAYDPSKPATHDYRAELLELEALHRERLNLAPRPKNARGLR